MLELVILLLIFVASFFLLRKDFEFGIKVLLVLSVLLHKEVFSIYRWDFLPVRAFMLALAAYAFFEGYLWLRKEKSLEKAVKFIKDPYVLLILLIWLFRAVSLVFSKNMQASILLMGFYTTTVVMLFLLYWRFVGQSEKLLGMIKLYINIAFVLVLFGFFQWYLYANHEIIIGALWNVPGHTPRIGSTFWDVNHFAALLASLLPVLGVLILVEGPLKKKAAYTFMFFVMTGMLFLTSSRTSWILAVVSLLSFLTILLVRRFGKKGILYILSALVIISIPFIREYSIKSSPFRAYIKQNFHYRLDSFASHLMLVQGSYQIFEDYPILGGGYGSFFEHFRTTPIAAEFFSRDPAALNTRVPAHTIWGEAMAETGVVGLSLLVLYLFVVLSVLLYGALKLKEKKQYLLSAAMFSTMLGLHIAGIFYSYNSEFFWLVSVLYFTLGLSMIGGREVYLKIFERFARSVNFLFLVIFGISAVLIFSNLGATHLIPWDEAIYAEIAKNMAKTGEYIDMYWKSGVIWYEKPPMFMWFVSISMKLLGYGSFAARLPSALFGLGTVALTFIVAKKYFGKMAAFVSSLALTTGIHFLYYSRAAMTDVTTTFFFLAGLFAYLKAKESKKWYLWLISGVLIGFGMMVKGAVGFIPFGIIGIYEIYCLLVLKEKLSAKTFTNMLILFVSALAVYLPWHIIMYMRYGQAFLDNYLIYHVFARASAGIEEKGQPIYWYFIVMKVSMRIWFIPLIPAFFYFIFKAVKKSKEYAFYLIWFMVVFTLFSLAGSKVVWYILPVYPAAAIMAGVFVTDVYKELQRRISLLKRADITFLLFFIMTVFSLTYLFYHRKMVYTDDLTSSQAELLKLKDEKLGTEEKIYIDRMEYPLVIFYSDSPYRISDYDAKTGKMPVPVYDQRTILLTKKGRFTKDPVYGKEPVVIKEDGDYILWYYDSDLNIDKLRLEEIEKTLKQMESTGAYNWNAFNLLTEEQDKIEARMSFYQP